MRLSAYNAGTEIRTEINQGKILVPLLPDTEFEEEEIKYKEEEIKYKEVPADTTILPPIDINDWITDTRHRCPHHPKTVGSKSSKPCMLTEYATRYTPKQGEMVQSCKPSQDAQLSDAKMADYTTNKIDFVAHPLEKKIPRQPEIYEKPTCHMEDMSSYKKEYSKKELPLTKAYKPTLSRKVAGSFKGTPTYRADYREWTPHPPNRVRKENDYKPPTTTFAGTTGYNDEYQAKRASVRSSMKPPHAINENTQPFIDDTSYKVEYAQKAMPAREVKEKVRYMPNKAPLDDMTSYNNAYFEKHAVKLPSCKPDGGAIHSDAPFSTDTTQRIDFQTWPLNKPFVREPEVYVKSDTKMEDMSTSHREYTKKPIDPPRIAKPLANKAVSGRFYSDTTTKVDYQKWAPIANNRVQKTSNYHPPTDQFTGQSSYSDNYIKHKGSMRQSLKPPNNASQTDAPFDDNTGYKIDYGKKPLLPRENREKPVWIPNKVRFDGNTNYTDDFNKKTADRVHPYKPDQTPKSLDIPFSDATTQRTDFQAWQGEKPYVHPHEQYQAPTGSFDGITTHQLNYTAKPLEPPKPVRPQTTGRVPGHFSDHTTYNADYIKKAPNLERVTKKTDYAPPEVPFAGNSSYADNFVRHPGASVRNSLKPATNAVGTGAPFEGQTMYYTDYYKRDLPICPVNLINCGTTESYKFQNQDNTGHKWYEKTGTPPRYASNVQLPVS